MRCRPTKSRLLTVAGLTALALPVLASSASGETVTCGQVITSDVTLSNDLVDCPTDGLVVGSDGITIDLNGHTIAGRFAGYDCQSGCLGRHGIDNSGGFDRITIRNGTIGSFGHVVHLTATKHSVLDGLKIVASGPIAYPRVGIFLSGSRHNWMRTLHVEGGDPAILFDGSVRNRLGESSVRGSIGFHAGDALHLAGASDHNRVAHNRLRADGAGLLIADSDYNLVANNQVHVKFGNFLRSSEHTRIIDNALDGGRSSGLTLEDSNRSVIGRNSVSSNGPAWGMQVAGDRNHVSANDVGQAYYGGIEIAGALNKLTSNGVTDAGIQGDGIAVLAGSRESVLDHNRTSHALDDGIDIDAAGTRLYGNTANGNGDLGIEAVPGVIDLGGNTASGNGNPLQCLNVFCQG